MEEYKSVFLRLRYYFTKEYNSDIVD